MAGDTFFQKRIAVALIALAIVGGILIAQWVNTRILRESVEAPTQESQQAIISEIILASLIDPNQREQENPALRQSASYTTADFLALRITTRPEVISPVQLGARLRTEAGAIVELDPPSMTLPPGQSTFCCWQVMQEDTYTLQLFRPEGIITSIPLRIRKASGTGVEIFRGL